MGKELSGYIASAMGWNTTTQYCNECRRVMVWIMFSLYIFFSLVRAYPYLMDILVTSCVCMHVCAQGTDSSEDVIQHDSLEGVFRMDTVEGVHVCACM